MCEWKNIRERVKNEEKSQREPKKSNKQNTMRKYHDPKSIRNHRKSFFFSVSSLVLISMIHYWISFETIKHELLLIIEFDVHQKTIQQLLKFISSIYVMGIFLLLLHD